MDEQERYRWIATYILPHEHGVRQWLRRHVHTLSPNDIDNILLEAYARVWATDFSQIMSGRKYFYLVAQELLLEHSRRARVVPVERLREIDALKNATDPLIPDPPMSARREVERLLSIVAAMPGKCRRAFELRKLEGLTLRDTALRMGATPKTVQKHLTKALAAVIAAIGSQPDPAADQSLVHGALRDTAGRRD